MTHTIDMVSFIIGLTLGAGLGIGSLAVFIAWYLRRP